MADMVWRGRIESLAQDGSGIGTLVTKADGEDVKRPVFVPRTVPGDEVEARIVRQERKYLFAELIRVTKPSPHRVEPACGHFGECGGCELSHVEYEEQLAQKVKTVEFLLRRRGIEHPPITVVPSKLRKGYRYRARIAVRIGPQGVVAGFRRAGSHEIVKVESCAVVTPQIMAFIALLNAAEYAGEEEELEVTAVLGRNGKLGVLVRLDDRRDKRAVKLLFDQLFGANRTLISNLFFEERDKLRIAGQVQEHIHYEADGFLFSFLPDSFVQANLPTNRLLIAQAMEYSGEGEAAIDLYAGIGNLTLPLARRFAAVVAVEGDKRSAKLGEVNAAKNKVANAKFLARSVEQYLHEHRRAGKGLAEYPAADVILLDPPRTGLADNVVDGLLDAQPPRIVYVSCDATTLARDLRSLQKRYEVGAIACVDMFPDTMHIETVVKLERK